MNRLLNNMKNKVDVINGAIDQCKRLINNETITLKGLHTISINRGQLTDQDLQNRIKELNAEKSNLLIRIDRMSWKQN